MTTPPSHPSHPTAPAELIRKLASESLDPSEVESLLRSAEKIEEADRGFQLTQAAFSRTHEQASNERLGSARSQPLPAWAVVSVLLCFFLFLVYLARTHYA